jgi:tetratricopeptide (TPR) repeat protein
MPLDKDLAQQLRQALCARQITQGMRILDGAEAEWMGLGPESPHSAQLLLLLAQWVDLGYHDSHVLDILLARFDSAWRRQLRTGEYLQFRMVEAFRSLANGELDSAIAALELVLDALRDLPDEGQEAWAHFWKGRAHRKKGEYDASLADIVRARELAQREHNEFFRAEIQIQESWLLFQKGLTRDALELLDEADSVLRSTDNYIALGNIQSARGRIVRRSGEYAKALEYFTRAIEIYARRDSNHVNVARALMNAAYSRRLLALQIRKRIENRAISSQSQRGAVRRSHSFATEPLRARYRQISQHALQDLMRARQIYELHQHSDGIGNVALNLGFLYLDRGEIDRATPEAAQAYRIGMELDDHILMARARILEAAIENAHVEEQTGEDVDVAVHAGRAREYSEEALKLAHGTQHRRLLAGACIARGMTAANEFFQDWETARRCAAEAAALIGPGESDHLVEDLAQLKSRIVQASGINDTLRGWSEGMVGNKTFQQITEEFAEIVIPKVWMRENRKISRVAACLSISPKKVRRILRNVGSVERG